MIDGRLPFRSAAAGEGHKRCNGQVLSQIGRNQLPPTVGPNLSQRQDLIDQPIVQCFERIDDLTPANSKPSCRSSVSRWRTPARCAAPHNIASQNASRCCFTASSAAERSSFSVPCVGSTARHAPIVVRISSTAIPALRIATLLNSAVVVSTIPF
jgi:hypothetical protein